MIDQKDKMAFVLSLKGSLTFYVYISNYMCLAILNSIAKNNLYWIENFNLILTISRTKTCMYIII